MRYLDVKGSVLVESSPSLAKARAALAKVDQEKYPDDQREDSSEQHSSALALRVLGVTQKGWQVEEPQGQTHREGFHTGSCSWPLHVVGSVLCSLTWYLLYNG